MAEKRILTVEINHKSASLLMRENLALNWDETIDRLQIFSTKVEEVFILSTCNRLAVYAYTESMDPLLAYFVQLGVPRSCLTVCRNDQESATHLFSTISGLESQILGEQQIVGQLKKALQMGKDAGTIGPILGEFVREALRVNKLVRRETGIGRYSTSVASAAFQIIRNMYGDLLGKTALIIGTGKIATLACSIIKSTKVSKVYIASHDYQRAVMVAKKMGMHPISISDLHPILNEVDIVIGGTHKEVRFWNEDLLINNTCPKDQLELLGDKERIFIDLGMPRNFNPAMKKIPNLYLFDMDNIKLVVEESLNKRKDVVPQAEKLINEQVGQYLELLSNRKLSPVYGAYWNKLEKIKKENLAWLRPKFGTVDDREWKLLEKFSHKIICEIAKVPFSALRNAVANDQLKPATIEAMLELHGIDQLDLVKVPQNRSEVLMREEIKA